MSNAAVFAAGLSMIAADLNHIRIDPRKLKFHRSRIEPTDPIELAERNERRRALAASWLEKPINPIIVRDGDYAIGDGNERVSGLLLLSITEITVQLLPADTPDSALDEIALLTDFHKTSLSPFERANVARKLRDSSEMTGKELAARLRIDPGYLTRLLSLFKCPEEVIEAARHGKIGPGDWYAISDSPDPLCTLGVKLNGATVAQLAASVKAAKNPPKPEDEPGKNGDDAKVTTLTIALPGGKTVILKGKGLTLADGKGLLDTASRMVEKAKSDGLSAKSAVSSWKDKAKKPLPSKPADEASTAAV